MCFPDQNTGINIYASNLKEKDLIKALFAENPGLVIQVKDAANITALLNSQGVSAVEIATVNFSGTIQIDVLNTSWEVSALRDIWYKSSYLLDQQQSGQRLAKERFENYKNQPLHFSFPENWTGTYEALKLAPNRKTATGAKAAVIREKGVNGDREMAYSLWLAGFDVKDIHMTDLISGRENLEDVNMIVFVGGFSNSDVLGSAKGWAGAFLYNEKAKNALDNFYVRKDTLSLGVCNGCQLMVALDLINPEHKKKAKMLHNESHKFESSFVNVTIPKNDSVMFGPLSGQRLGVWVAHGEGKFDLPAEKDSYHFGMEYSYEAYPGNPNGSDHNVAGLASKDGRHLAIMPHIERAIAPWNWPYYTEELQKENVSPWIVAFINARNWVVEKNSH